MKLNFVLSPGNSAVLICPCCASRLSVDLAASLSVQRTVDELVRILAESHQSRKETPLAVV